jgi:anaphase-promoting complex subunit 11
LTTATTASGSPRLPRNTVPSPIVLFLVISFVHRRRALFEIEMYVLAQLTPRELLHQSRSRGCHTSPPECRFVRPRVLLWLKRVHLHAAPPPPPRLSLNIKTWHGVGAWTWGAGDAGDVCGICRIAYDGCPPDAKFPGDDSPVVWGTCAHAYHLQCITKWLSGQGAEPRCPLCRQPWEFKQL